jgi:hypothetical protein
MWREQSLRHFLEGVAWAQLNIKPKSCSARAASATAFGSGF